MDAQNVFDTLDEQNIVTWTVLITSYLENGQDEEALGLYYDMRKAGIKPDEAILVCILKVCAQIGLRESLMTAYMKCASLEDAHTLFVTSSIRDVTCWSSIIAGYSLHGHNMESLELYKNMEQDGVQPNEMTFPPILKACTGLKRLECGKLVHNQIVNLGFENDNFIRSTLIEMYACAERMEEACSVFRQTSAVGDDVLLNIMIGAFVECDQNEQALELFGQICQEGVELDHVMFLWVLRACLNIREGRLMHALAIKQGFDVHVEVQNTVISMYSKMGSLDDAHAIFNSLSKRTIQSYSVLFLGHSLFGCFDEALQLYHQMNVESMIQQDQSTLTLILKICATFGTLSTGRLIYTMIAESSLDREPFMGNIIMDFFATLGSVTDTDSVFNGLHLQDMALCNVLIGAYAENGYFWDALRFFRVMQEDGIEPDERTFLCLLNASGHAGSIILSYNCFWSIIDHKIVPNSHHFTSLIDALTRAGLLCEAEMLIMNMPMEPSLVAWTALLGCGSKHVFSDCKSSESGCCNQ
ncbi:hypothetical protein KP509_20G005800 [Ceratopteris richardii]|uniref:Pentatricopeptide repeat-containing protein n=1 Tax=Ceratopteris richardii TaxID=49495 RepID=A0A8T2SFP2_CERRI|nr:hypothetical protein KP509_20G005800 [Ceratopteris richardii]